MSDVKIGRLPCEYMRIGDKLQLLFPDGTILILHPKEWAANDAAIMPAFSIFASSGYRSSYYDDEDDDFTKWSKRQDGDKKEPIKCNCGAAKVGGIPHYEWCAIYNLEKVAPPLPRD